MPPAPSTDPQARPDARAAAIRVGCAGWSLPREAQARFPTAGSHLERYAARLPAVEIDSSFYRPHRPATYARWAASVPPGFRFSVKIPRAITHERHLVDAAAGLDVFLPGPAALGEALGCLLVQLPPSLALDVPVAEEFLAALRARHAGAVVVEPRHASWFTATGDALLTAWRVGRVAADPARVPTAALPGGWSGTVYYRLHGSPRIYHSPYDDAALDALVAPLRDAPSGAWCIFDNTALGAATENALDLLDRLAARAA